MDTLLLTSINNRLVTKYGRNVFDNRPNFRLILNQPSLAEKRWASVFKYDDNGNFLGIEEGVQERPKYTYIPYGVYILERLQFKSKASLPREIAMIEENCHGIYEPMWPFMSREFEYLEPTYEGCEFIIESNRAIERGKIRKKIPSQREITEQRNNKLMEGLDDAHMGVNKSLIHSRPYLSEGSKLISVEPPIVAREVQVGKEESHSQSSGSPDRTSK